MSRVPGPGATAPLACQERSDRPAAECSVCLEPAVPVVPGLPSLNVALRTLVSFEGNFPKTTTVPGREIAELLTERLRAAGFEVADPEKLTGYAWLVGGRFPAGQVASLVGLTDDPPIEWQVHTYPPRIRPRWLGGPRRDELQATVRTWCQAIHDVLAGRRPDSNGALVRTGSVRPRSRGDVGRHACVTIAAFACEHAR